MKKNLVTGIFALFAFAINAQNLTFDNVQKIEARNSNAIKEGTDVKGYFYFFISVIRSTKKTNEYTLRIVDNNLKSLKDIKFQDSKHVSILESSFNGADLIFLLYNDDQNTFEYQVYGADGNKKFVYNRKLTKKEEKYLEQTYLAMEDDESTYKGLYPVEGLGFISNMPSREDNDYTFQVDFFSSEKNRQWTYIPTIGGKRFIGDYLGTFNGVVYLEVLKFTSKTDQKPESSIVGLSLETGKQLFEKPTDSKYRFYPASMSTINGGKTFIYGEYFDLNGNISKDKSRGFAFLGIR